jgi:hypothetical protein
VTLVSWWSMFVLSIVMVPSTSAVATTMATTSRFTAPTTFVDALVSYVASTGSLPVSVGPALAAPHVPVLWKVPTVLGAMVDKSTRLAWTSSSSSSAWVVAPWVYGSSSSSSSCASALCMVRKVTRRNEAWSGDTTWNGDVVLWWPRREHSYAQPSLAKRNRVKWA